ncbi:hypothetical protein BH11PSE13_BH11PSE13_32400 [soil metagenome]
MMVCSPNSTTSRAARSTGDVFTPGRPMPCCCRTPRPRSLRSAVYAIADAHGGTFSAEHGIGQSLRSEMARYKPAVELEMMRGIKRLFDPQGLMNPGKVLPD